MARKALTPSKSEAVLKHVQAWLINYQRRHPKARCGVRSLDPATDTYAFVLVDPAFRGVPMTNRYKGRQSLPRQLPNKHIYFELMTPEEAAAAPLLQAAAQGDAKLVRTLIRSGVNVNQDFGDATPLHQAAGGKRAGHPKVIQALITAGADVDAGPAGTPLMRAAGRGSLANIRLLLKAGAKVNAASGQGTALHEAVEENRPDVVRLLLKAGADPQMTDGRGQSALDLARQKRRRNIVALLERASAGARGPARRGR